MDALPRKKVSVIKQARSQRVGWWAEYAVDLHSFAAMEPFFRITRHGCHHPASNCLPLVIGTPRQSLQPYHAAPAGDLVGFENAQGRGLRDNGPEMANPSFRDGDTEIVITPDLGAKLKQRSAKK